VNLEPRFVRLERQAIAPVPSLLGDAERQARLAVLLAYTGDDINLRARQRRALALLDRAARRREEARGRA